MTGYRRYNFLPTILLQMFFKRMKAFVSIKISVVLLQKNAKLNWKRHFKELISFDTRSTGNLTLCRFGYSEKKQFFSRKTPKFCTYLRNISISVAFYYKYAIIW